MSTPAKAVTLDVRGHTRVTRVANKQIATKQFNLIKDVETVLTGGVPGMKRRKLCVRVQTSPTSVIVYLGTSGVTVSDGWPMYDGDEVEFDVTNEADVRAIASLGVADSATVYVLELE